MHTRPNARFDVVAGQHLVELAPGGWMICREVRCINRFLGLEENKRGVVATTI